MNKEPRLLILEDFAADAELTERELRKAGLAFTVRRVETKDAFLQALTDFAPDVILSDYGLPQFNGLEALRIVKERQLDMPFILVTGSLTEEVAVECMKEGAADYILKSSLRRLPSAVRNVLEKRDARRAKDEASAALRRSEELFRSFVETTNEWIWAFDETGLCTYSNPAIETILGYGPEELLGKNCLLLMHEEDRREVEKMLPECIANKHGWTGLTLRWQHKDGSYRFLESNGVPILGPNGEFVGFRGADRDVTERKQAEEGLRRREAILEAVSLAAERFLRTNNWEQKSDEVLAYLGRATEASRTYIFENQVGPDDTLLTNQRYEWVAPGITPQINNPELQGLAYQAVGLARWSETLGRGETIHGLVREFPQCEQELLADEKILSIIVVPIFIGEHWWGNIGFDDCLHERVWTATEVDALKAAANTLGAAIQRQQSEQALLEREEQLRQSQKLEAIGRLAGGIAHDFNNLLTAITGYSDLTLRRLSANDPLHRNIEEISKAADRASALTHQLLAFSRKQVLQPKLLDLNAVVADMDKMLQRLLGEDIGILTVLESELGNVKADAGQIGQVILNLAVNARDAMSAGGKLTIETANVELSDSYARQHIAVQPGRYVMLAISDTGCGMDAETQSHVFEPFFTTKEQGKGTGLGLSTVYGIVKQSGGNIWVYSEVGRGTTFKVYLPRVDEIPMAPEIAAERTVSRPACETILLVEDEAGVRRLLREVLETEGYRVLETASGKEALQLSQSFEGEIQLMVTDVVMPEMSGREVAERFVPLRPEMKVIFMSGYTDDAIIHHGVLDPGMAFLEKPFTPDAAARKVREVLDTPQMKWKGIAQNLGTEKRNGRQGDLPVGE